VERSTGDVRQNGRITVRHAVAREPNFNQFGIGQLEATVRHPLDPQADMLERLWVTSRSVSVGGWPLFGLNRSPRRQPLLCYLPGILNVKFIQLRLDLSVVARRRVVVVMAK
jgi:hypothetical protein